MNSPVQIVTERCRFRERQIALHFFYESLKEPRVHRIWKLMLRAKDYGHTKFVEDCLVEVIEHIDGFYEEYMDNEAYKSDRLKYYGMSKKDFV